MQCKIRVLICASSGKTFAGKSIFKSRSHSFFPSYEYTVLKNTHNLCVNIVKSLSQGGRNSTKKEYLGFVLLTETILMASKFLGLKYVIRINHQLSPEGQSLEGQSTVGEPRQL